MATVGSVNLTERENAHVNKRRKELSTNTDFDNMKAVVDAKLENSPWMQRVTSAINNAMDSADVRSYKNVMADVCGGPIDNMSTYGNDPVSQHGSTDHHMPSVALSTQQKEDIFREWDKILHKK